MVREGGAEGEELGRRSLGEGSSHNPWYLSGRIYAAFPHVNSWVSNDIAFQSRTARRKARGWDDVWPVRYLQVDCCEMEVI